MKQGYDILRKFCNVRNETSALLQTNPNTPRATFIKETLDSIGIEYSVDIFGGRSELSNIEVTFDKGAKSSIMFIAHHDINNPYSENCQDNSASVANLLDLIGKVKDKDFNRNVIVVFTDCEEFGGKGASRLAMRINNGKFGTVDYVVNLELTANGTEIWSDLENSNLVDRLESVVCKELIKTLYIVNTPFNDSVVLRGRGIDSVCIGSLTDIEMEKTYERGYCSTWSLCHKENDKFELANRENMNKFVELLIKLI